MAINVPLRDLVALAYGISNLDAESRVIGGPDWMARERFDSSINIQQIETIYRAILPAAIAGHAQPER